ncbi:glycoside hydrolase family 16 protein [Actinoallomurus iriomotensis]|uniref:GH16 domain-containing protein n=1 Tax=Actinoallomurus iriomotensis TaxID=478107 RepID=A0A9W6SGY5_9ACTN|nr:glycoside hydrolase family 16 protein [Actinoallomurus iriomotensis]GLY92022.1 hypothetical protein Airi02_099500 [Actinoallomurus iriomotensis]
MRRTLRAAGCVVALAGTTLAAAPRPARAADPLPPGHWSATWQDEFDGSTLDGSKWTTWSASYSDACRGNKPDHKLEYNLPGNLSVANGRLTITARRQAHTSPGGTSYGWTSGLVATGDSCGHDPSGGAFVKKGDYIQIRTRLPGRIGMWPAFWTWNAGGNEVDVFEYHPDNPGILELTNHTGGGAADYHQTGSDVSAGWHYIGAYLGASSVDWYYDGKLLHSDGRGFDSDGAYLIVDLAVADGHYHDAPPSDVDSAQMLVDSVKVFRNS